MSAFQDAVAEFQRLYAIEVTLPSSTEYEEKALDAAVARTADAFSVLIDLPSENGMQAAAKLAVAAAYFNDEWMPRQVMGVLVSECVRFLGAAHLSNVGRAA